MPNDDMVKIPQFDRLKQFEETKDRHVNEDDRKIGSLQPGPRPGEDVPDKFLPNTDYVGTDAPVTGPLNRRGE